MALEKVKAIAAHINSAKADAEALAKLMQVQEKIPNCTFELVQPHRQIVREGSLNVVSTSKRLIGSGKPKSRYVFLFNDMLLWINEASSVMKGKILLTSSTSANQLDNLDLEIASNNEVFVARIADPSERKAWLDGFREVIRQQKFIYANKHTALNRRANTIPDVRRSSQSSEPPSAEVSVISTADPSDLDAKKSKRHNSFSSAMDMEGSDSEMEHHHHRTDSTEVLRSSPVKLTRGLTLLSKQPGGTISARSSISQTNPEGPLETCTITTDPCDDTKFPASINVMVQSPNLTPSIFTSHLTPSPSVLTPSASSPNLTPLSSADSGVSAFRPPNRPTSLSIPGSPADVKGAPKPRSPLGPALLPPPSNFLPPPPSPLLPPPSTALPPPPSILPPSSPTFPPPPLSPSPLPSTRVPPLLPPPSVDLPPPPSLAPDFIPPPPPEENDEPLPPPSFPPSPTENCTIRVSSNFSF